MADENFFNAADLDLEAALLAGFGLQGTTEDEAMQEAEPGSDGALKVHPTGGAHAHEKITHRPGKVGRLQVTFVYHHEHSHDG